MRRLRFAISALLLAFASLVILAAPAQAADGDLDPSFDNDGIRIQNRTAGTDVAFTWNPIDQHLETRVCDGCSRPVPAATLCDDRVHYLCASCFSPCPQCAKPFCHACHGTCPRRH